MLLLTGVGVEVEEVEGQPLKVSACSGRPVAMGFTAARRRAEALEGGWARGRACVRGRVGGPGAEQAAEKRTRGAEAQGGRRQPWGSRRGAPLLCGRCVVAAGEGDEGRGGDCAGEWGDRARVRWGVGG